jgi:hypothetical protein
MQLCAKLLVPGCGTASSTTPVPNHVLLAAVSGVFEEECDHFRQRVWLYTPTTSGLLQCMELCQQACGICFWLHNLLCIFSFHFHCVEGHFTFEAKRQLQWIWKPSQFKFLTNSVAPEPEGSSPHSWKPAKGPYPERGESTPQPPRTISLRSILIPSSHLRLGLSSGLFFFGLSHQTPVHVSPLSHACHMPRPLHCPWFCLPNNI